MTSSDPPRHRVRLTMQGPILIAFLAVVALLFALRLVSALRLRDTIHLLAREGNQTIGRVVAVETVHERYADGLAVTYTFSAGEVAQEHRYVAWGALQKRFTAGAATPVTFARGVSLPLPKEMLSSRQVRARVMADVPGMTLLLAILAFMFISVCRRALREYRFARHGVRIRGTVVETRGMRTRCRYRFAIPPIAFEHVAPLLARGYHPTAGSGIELLVLLDPVRSMPAGDLVYLRRVES